MKAGEFYFITFEPESSILIPMLKNIFLPVLLLLLTANLNAQQDNDYENMVNNQFGTLLEGLLVNGKLDEAGARSYLETVYGNDENVRKYLQGVNLYEQIKNTDGTKVSFDDYITNLGSNLFNLVPDNYKQELLKNPNYIGWQLGTEMSNGRVSNETLQNAFDILAEDIKKNKQRQEVIEKLKLLTPTIDKLKNTPYSKQVVINDASNTRNWKINPVKKAFSMQGGSYNKVTVEQGNVVLDPTAGEYFTDKFLNIYSNNEKFDFSKDFKITIKGKLDTYKYNKVTYLSTTFSVLIGQYYKFESNLVDFQEYKKHPSYSYFSVKMPEPIFTQDYGVFNFEDIYFLTKNDKVKTVVSSLDNSRLKKANPVINPDLNFDNGFELVITSQNGYLSYFINGIDTGIKKQITYMPNKYSLDIKADYIQKTTIEYVKLEHL